MTIIKEHVSYSEIKVWKECGWRHKLVYVDKIQTFEESPHLHYGTIIHDACEHYLKTKELKIDEMKQSLIEAWQKHGFDSEDYIILQTNRAKLQGWEYKHSNIEEWLKFAEVSISAVPLFLNETFPNWELVSAEEQLYENIEDMQTKFKGYIDCIIKVPYKDKYKYWILDWKTASSKGWMLEKQRDFLMQAQLFLYKSFWGNKNNIKLTDINCAFILLKKVNKIEKACQLIKISSGPVTLDKSIKLVKNMINSVNKNLFLKNRESCKFCEFKNTMYCK
jgi:hypothetical protein